MGTHYSTAAGAWMPYHSHSHNEPEITVDILESSGRPRGARFPFLTVPQSGWQFARAPRIIRSSHVLISPCAPGLACSERSPRIVILLLPSIKKKTTRDNGIKPVSAATLKLRLLKKLKCTLRYEKLAWTAGAK